MSKRVYTFREDGLHLLYKGKEAEDIYKAFGETWEKSSPIKEGWFTNMIQKIKGFTLIEVLTLIAIAAILLAIIWPVVQRNQRPPTPIVDQIR